MSWFDEVTGSNEYERQSWRDSFNGGRAAGDITGNVNRRLDAERAAFQGTTWSGSSTQPSALELARALGATGPAIGHVSTGGGSAHSVGPGNGGVGNPAVPGPGGSRVKVGSNLTLFPDEHITLPLDSPSKVVPIVIGGKPVIHDRGWSNASDAEDRWGEGELLSPTWFYQWGVVAADANANYNALPARPFEPVSWPAGTFGGPTWGDIGGHFGRGFSPSKVEETDLPNPMSYQPISGW